MAFVSASPTQRLRRRFRSGGDRQDAALATRRTEAASLAARRIEAASLAADMRRQADADRTRDAAGAEADVDLGRYACSCGFLFQATVTTSVACPHCGDAQAW